MALLLLPIKPNLQLFYEGVKSVNGGTDSSVLKSSLQMSLVLHKRQEKNFACAKAMPKLRFFQNSNKLKRISLKQPSENAG